jgi:predicted TIM-barrel fold metal-dependent hydrolase
MLPYFERIQDWGVPVVLHPALRPRGADVRYNRERSLGREYDIAQAVVGLIHAVLPRYPRLRFVVPHCGGAFPFLMGRVRMFYAPEGAPPDVAARARMRAEQESSGFGPRFDALCRALYFDGCGQGGWDTALAFTLRVVGPDRLLFGTDYPLEAGSAETMREYRQLFESLPLSDAERAAVLGGTAETLLRRPQADAGRS